jgi:glycosyltransferase involved in cell wall biosynthesis
LNNILYVLGSYFPSQQGGPNNTIHWQAKYINNKGLDVTVASLKSGLTDENIENYKIKLNVINNIEGVKTFYFDFFKNKYLSFSFYFWAINNIKKFDFVQLTSYFFPITWFAALICIFYNVPFSIAPRGELEDNALKYNFLLKIFLHKYFLRHIFNKAYFVMVTSQQEHNFTRKFFNNDMNFELIPNFINLNHIKPLSKSSINNKKGVLYLGRIHPKKGIERLIEAYKNLDEELIKDNPLLIVGGGEEDYILSLKNLSKGKGNAPNNIFFLGHKEAAEKELLYRNSKIFVLPSFSENFGNVVLESLSFSTPVIASMYTPWSDLNEYECGSWIENEVQNIKESLIFFLTMDKGKYTQYAKNSYSFVHDKYDINQNKPNLTGMYKSYFKR